MVPLPRRQFIPDYPNFHILTVNGYLISLREAISYASQNIVWTAAVKDDFAASTWGYDFSSATAVVAEDMVADKSYYKPARYDGTKACIENAMIVFDDSLTGDTITLSSELVIPASVVIDGTLGSGNGVIIDRGLIEYHAEEWDISKVYGTPDFDANKVWVYKGATDPEGKPTEFGRVMSITTLNPVVLANMTIQGGYNGGVGTGINSTAELTLNHVNVKGNFVENKTKGVAINMSTGTLHMYGGSIEGNASNTRGTINVDKVSSAYESLIFDGVEVFNNSVSNGSFIESYINGGEVIIKDTYAHDNDGNVFHSEGHNTNFTITDSLFENNFGYGGMWFSTGIINFENTIFDNSDYLYSDIYKAYPQYLSPAAVSVYGLSADTTTAITFDNCLFLNYIVTLGSYGTSYHFDIDATFNNCTISAADEEYFDEDWLGAIIVAGTAETVSVQLNNSLILGNSTDFCNNDANEAPNATINNSIVGRYHDNQGNVVLTDSDSIVETQQGAIEFVSTTPGDVGYYEVNTATIAGRGLVLRDENGSVVGYHASDSTSLDMATISADYFATIQVNTLDDAVDPTDNMYSLREALLTIERKGLTDVSIVFNQCDPRASIGVANTLLTGWRWSDDIAENCWYYDGSNVVRNEGAEPVSGWLPGNWSDPLTLTQESVTFNKYYDVAQWQYTEEVPATSWYVDNDGYMVQNSTEANCSGWMPVSWTQGSLSEEEIEAATNASDWSIVVPAGVTLDFDGTLSDESAITIGCIDGVAGDAAFVNSGTLTLSDVVLATVFVQKGTTTVQGNVTLEYLTNTGEDPANPGEMMYTQGTVSVASGVCLTIRDYYETYAADPAKSSVFVIHNTKDTVLTIGATDGKITEPAGDFLTVTSTVTSELYAGDTANTRVADILFFGNALPVSENQATFAVTRRQGETLVNVTDKFVWVRNADNEAIGVMTGNEAVLAGDYTITVSCGHVSDSADFTIKPDVLLTLDPTSAVATPRNDTDINLDLSTITISNFIGAVTYTVKWKDAGGVTDDVSQYFVVKPASDTPDALYHLYYKGGLAELELPEDQYIVTVTATADAIGQNKSSSADFALTIVTPTMELTPNEGEVTDFTAKSELADITLENFSSTSFDWTFKLAGGTDTTHFKVEDNKLIYMGHNDLASGVYTLVVTASDGIDSFDCNYKLTIKACTLDVISLFATITTNNHDLNVARLNPVNFPAGEIDYTISCTDIGDISQYFVVQQNAGGNTYLYYKSGLGEGVYDININATCTPTNPDDGNVEVESFYQLEITKAGTEASVVLDPTTTQKKTAEIADGLQLATVTLNAFEDVPTISVQAYNTTVKEGSNEVVMTDFSDCFTVTDGKLTVVQTAQTQKLLSGDYDVKVTAKTYSADHSVVQQAYADFVLVLYDEKVETDYTNITIDFQNGQFEVKDTDDPTTDPIDQGEANVLIIELQDSEHAPTITITAEAMKNLDAIHIESAVENTIVIEGATEEPQPGSQVANHFVIDSAAEVYHSPTAVAITALEATTGTQIAKTTSSGTKSISLTSPRGMSTLYDINVLSTDITITPNSANDASDTVSFAGDTSKSGIVLNLDKTDYSQLVYSGQSGTLKLNARPGEIVLSPGNDIVTGSASGSIITDNSDSWNIITLNGETADVENTVTLTGGATIIVNGAATNTIVAEDAANTIVNLSKSTGTCNATIIGDNTTITGGTGALNLNLTGNKVNVNSPNCQAGITVNLVGNNAIITTGKGNDEIHINGNGSIVSTREGNDRIYVEGNSKDNTINTGDGDDTVISTSTDGNTFYTENGNDFIIGGDGRDTIFGSTGNSLLAGGKGADRIFGGSARDIMLANISSNLENKTVEELLEIRNLLFETKPWWDNFEDALEVLGDSSVSDGAIDSLSRTNTASDDIDAFFRNSLMDGDILYNALENDRIFD